MTVTYINKVATTSTQLGCFWTLLFRWRGSLYKLIWREFLVYAGLYTSLSLLYRMGLTEAQKRVFEKLSLLVEESTQLIPTTFVLGFYVTLVMTRWWDIYMSIPWPDTLAMFVSTNIPGKSEQHRVVRRTIMRYANLTFALALSDISPKMKKRTPTYDHMVALGLLMEEESKVLLKLEEDQTEPRPPIYWVPILWATELGYKARELNMLKDDFATRKLGKLLNEFRSSCGNLLSYDYINIPLVYTQVVTIAVYTFFLSTILGRQFLDPSQGIPGHSFDTYVPVYTVMQFFFYMGWLKVGENLSNPFGEDDDDFDVCYLLDRNLKVSYMVVDGLHGTCPNPRRDLYFRDVVPKKLLYTEAAEPFRIMTNAGTASAVRVDGYNLRLDDDEIAWLEDALMGMMEDAPLIDLEAVDGKNKKEDTALAIDDSVIQRGFGKGGRKRSDGRRSYSIGSLKQRQDAVKERLRVLRQQQEEQPRQQSDEGVQQEQNNKP